MTPAPAGNMVTIDLLNNRPVITQCAGSDTEIYSQFGFPIGRIIDLSELGEIYRTGRTKCKLLFLSAIASTVMYKIWRGYRAVKAREKGGLFTITPTLSGLVLYNDNALRWYVIWIFMKNWSSVKEQSQGKHSIFEPIRASLLLSDWPKF